MATNTTDAEKGLVSATARSATSSWTPAPQNNASTNESTEHTPLQLFQLLVGIHTPSSLNRNGTTYEVKSSRDRSGNVGLYQRAKDQERSSRIAYLCTSFISNTLYLIQILLAATFTALSAYKETAAVTLTVLGAVNTVLAG